MTNQAITLPDDETIFVDEKDDIFAIFTKKKST